MFYIVLHCINWEPEPLKGEETQTRAPTIVGGGSRKVRIPKTPQEAWQVGVSVSRPLCGIGLQGESPKPPFEMGEGFCSGRGPPCGARKVGPVTPPPTSACLRLWGAIPRWQRLPCEETANLTWEPFRVLLQSVRLREG